MGWDTVISVIAVLLGFAFGFILGMAIIAAFQISIFFGIAVVAIFGFLALMTWLELTKKPHEQHRYEP